MYRLTKYIVVCDNYRVNQEEIMDTSTTVHPVSIDEVQHALQDWLSNVPSALQTSIRIKRLLGDAGPGLVVSSRPHAKMKMRATSDLLMLTSGRQKMHLLLDNFDVVTELSGEYIVVELKYTRQPGSRHLKEGFESLSKSKNVTFAARAMRAIAELDRDLSPIKLEEASAAPNDYLVLVDALAAAPALAESLDKDPLSAAKLRGATMQQELIKANGGAISVGEVSKLLRISRQAVDKRRRQGQLIGLALGRRGYAYPAWQFENSTTVAGLEQTLDVLRSHDGWMQVTFFVNPNDRLNGRSPLDSLRRGETEGVIEAARAFGEHGAA
jgi:hypothetical protein